MKTLLNIMDLLLVIFTILLLLAGIGSVLLVGSFMLGVLSS